MIENNFSNWFFKNHGRWPSEEETEEWIKKSIMTDDRFKIPFSKRKKFGEEKKKI